MLCNHSEAIRAANRNPNNKLSSDLSASNVNPVFTNISTKTITDTETVFETVQRSNLETTEKSK